MMLSQNLKEFQKNTFNPQPLFLKRKPVMEIVLKNGKNVQVYTHIEYVNKYNNIKDVVNFYNEYLPLSKHSIDYKISKYEKTRTVVYVVMDNDKMVGLLESWLSETSRHLVTAITHCDYTKNGMFKQLFDKLIIDLKVLNCGKLSIHFRKSNYDTHSKIYERVGFTQLKKMDNYTNREDMWEMEYNFNNNSNGVNFDKKSKNRLFRHFDTFKRKIGRISKR